MNRSTFKQERLTGNKLLLNQLITQIARFDPVSLYMIGSQCKGKADEFSDLDILAIFNGFVLQRVLQKPDNLFSSIAPILIKHENPTLSPVAGRYSLVLHKTKHGIFQVDYYLAPLSTAKIPCEAKLIYGKDTIPKGELSLSTTAKNPKDAKERIDFLACMSFIAIKTIARGRSKDFIPFLLKEYSNARKYNLPSIPEIMNEVASDFIEELLGNLYLLSNANQRTAITEIRSYYKLVRSLYSTT